jgi:hypothetical protein
MVTPSAGRERAAELRGRLDERGFLDRLIDAVRAGESRALVLVGEAGRGGQDYARTGVHSQLTLV